MAAANLHRHAWLNKADAYFKLSAHHTACNVQTDICTQGYTTKHGVCELCRCWRMCCVQVIVHDGLHDGRPCNLLQPVYAAPEK